jgi:cysteinyl-tRNA synthetase
VRGVGTASAHAADSDADLGAELPAAPDLDAATDAEDLARTILAALPAVATDERSAVVALVHQAEAASATHDRELAGRAVQALVDLRADSRAAGDWSASDRLRHVLAGVGVEVRDSREGSTWQWM